jgi:hypothetical protein
LTEGYKKRKKIFLSICVTGVSLLIVTLCLRTIPRVSDAISGKPQYMRWIADKVAESIAGRYGNEAAVIILADERSDCRQISNVNVPNPDNFYYVVSYSEAAHALCFITYADLPKGWGQANSVVLHPSTGHNFGRKLNGPVRAVAIAQLQMVYPLEYLSLLHWRATIDSASFRRAANGKFERWFSSSTEPGESMDVEIDFPSLRADVGQRHRLVNQALMAVIVASILLIAFAGYKTWTSYQQFDAFLTRYHASISLRAYVWQDLSEIADHARESYQQQQKRALEQARAAIVSKRSKEAIRGRLESILAALLGEQARLRVQECLARDDLGEMKALMQEMQGQVGQRSPEEKLTDLLDSLKPYCSDEELDGFCAQAFHILATAPASFKDARSFVVSTHDQLRARLKEAEVQKITESE